MYVAPKQKRISCTGMYFGCFFSARLSRSSPRAVAVMRSVDDDDTFSFFTILRNESLRMITDREKELLVRYSTLRCPRFLNYSDGITLISYTCICRYIFTRRCIRYIELVDIYIYSKYVYVLWRACQIA